MIIDLEKDILGDGGLGMSYIEGLAPLRSRDGIRDSGSQRVDLAVAIAKYLFSIFRNMGLSGLDVLEPRSEIYFYYSLTNSTELEAVIWPFGDSLVYASGITHTHSQETVDLLINNEGRSMHGTMMISWSPSMYHSAVVTLNTRLVQLPIQVEPSMNQIPQVMN